MSKSEQHKKKSSARAEKGTGAAQLREILEQRVDCSVLLITAPDRIRRERAVRHAIDYWTNDNRKTPTQSAAALSTALSVHRLSAGELSLHDIAKLSDSASSFDLFTPVQISYIRDLDDASAAVSKELVKILPRFTPAHRLVLTAAEIPAKHPVAEYCKEQRTAVSLEPLRGFELQRWAEKELRRLGFSECTEDACMTLVAAAEEDTDRVAAMAEQLASYCASSRVTRADVEALFPHQVIPGEFDFLDALAAGNAARAELMLTELLASGKNAFMLLAMIHRSFSNYLGVRTLTDEGDNPQAIRQKLGLSPWVYNKALSTMKRSSADQLVRAMKTLVAIDSRMKNKSLGPLLLMSEMIAELSSHEKTARVGASRP